MSTYTISNSNGMAGGVWSRTYESRKEARAAIAEAYGWDEVVLSPSWEDDDGLTCWSAYETQDECDADETGAQAPCITRHDDELVTIEERACSN